MSPRFRTVVVLLLPAAFAVASMVGVQAQQAAAPPRGTAQAAPPVVQGPKASEKYMNLKELGDLPASQLPDAMVFMSASLGFTCESCHVRQSNGEFAFEKDDKENKQAARRMIGLVKGLNTEYFNSQPEVSCSTCHQGRRSPMSLAPVVQPFTADQLAQQAAQASLPPGTRPPAPKETVDQVIARYFDAIGGEAAAQKVTSAVMRGTATNRAGQAVPVVVSEKAPGRYRVAMDTKTPSSRGYDGTVGWMKYGASGRELHGVETQALSREASPWLGAGLKASFTRLQAGRYDRIDGREVITLNGTVSPEVMEALSFDRETGLLVRRIVRLRTALGRLQVQIDYANYRPVDGLKIPFDVKVSDWQSVTEQKFTDVKLNAPVDDSAFVR
jgi:hypothetical protein